VWNWALQAAAESPVGGSRRLRRMAGAGGLLTSDCVELLNSLQQLKRSCGDVLAHLRLSFPRFHFTGEEELLRTVALAGRHPALTQPSPQPCGPLVWPFIRHITFLVKHGTPARENKRPQEHTKRLWETRDTCSRVNFSSAIWLIHVLSNKARGECA